MFSQPQSQSSYLVGHSLVALVVFLAFYLVFVHWGQTGSDVAARRSEVEKQRPQILLVGNSILRAAVDVDQLGRQSGYRTVKACSNGSASAWWYLYVKNVVARSEHKPDYLGIMFRDTFLTEPVYRVTNVYQRPIRRLMTGSEPLLQKLSYGKLAIDQVNSPFTWLPREARNWLNLKIEKRTEDLLMFQQGTGREALRRTLAASNMVSGWYNEYQLGYEMPPSQLSYDFSAQIEHSYLPPILALLEKYDVTPIFIRAKRRHDLEFGTDSEELRNYISDLCQYVQSRGALWFDFTTEQRITLRDYGPGDHLNETVGKKHFTQLLADRITPRLAELESVRSR